MGRRKLPRELDHAINRLAHMRTTGKARSAYQREKVRILQQVVLWLGEGKNLDDVLAILAVPKSTELQRTLRELAAQIWGQP